VALSVASAAVPTGQDTVEVDALHAEWLRCGLWVLPTLIGPELHERARRRWDAGEPVGRITETVEEKPWNVREFALLDLDNNQLRFGRPIDHRGAR
jgi:hypothetical protein